MAPISLTAIKRKVQEKPDSRRIYLVFEGTATEPEFLESILVDQSAINNPAIFATKTSKCNTCL